MNISMKKMIAIIVLLGVLAFTSTAMFAEEGKARDAKPKQGERGKPGPGIWEKMKEPLQLTDGQLQSIKEVMADQAEEMKMIRKDTTLSQDAKKEKVRELRTEGREEVEAILTSEQKEKMKSMREKRRGEGARKERSAKKQKAD